jgi:hypothetical protein
MKKKEKKLPIKLNNFEKKEIDFRYQKVVSFTQFSMFQSCPHKWANQYVRKLIKSKHDINMTFGTAIHNTLQNYLKVMYNESGAAADRLNLIGYFENSFQETYLKEVEENEKIHFTTPDVFSEFYEDGVEILDWFKKNRRKYFNNKNTYLVGIEVPIQKELKKNVIFTGSIDFILYDEILNKIYIFDIKTSTKGWNSFNKKDDNKTSQLLLYKQFFSELYGFPIENIEVEFFIVKRKIEPTEYIEYPKRIQTFKPTDGPRKIKSSQDKLLIFINEGFNEVGKLIDKEYEKKPGPLCEWCPFYNGPNCDAKFEKKY